MRIRTPQHSARERKALTIALAAMAAPAGPASRACEGCQCPCPCSGSRTCACGCGPACPSAASALSTDGERYPVEPAIVPLVFAFQSLGGCVPCWSCEGHLDVNGGLMRPPQVWFYARSPIYLRLLGDCLSALRASGRLAHPWQIRLSYSEGDLDPAFSLEPDLLQIADPALHALQADVPVLAEALAPEMRRRAREILDRCGEAR